MDGLLGFDLVGNLVGVMLGFDQGDGLVFSLGQSR